jgi:DNA repair exonuclease SbcCD ATPase subunit
MEGNCIYRDFTFKPNDNNTLKNIYKIDELKFYIGDYFRDFYVDESGKLWKRISSESNQYLMANKEKSRLFFLFHPEKLLPKKVNEISETISQIQTLIKEKEENINILKKSIDIIENTIKEYDNRIYELEKKNIHQQSINEELQRKLEELTDRVDTIGTDYIVKYEIDNNKIIYMSHSDKLNDYQ